MTVCFDCKPNKWQKVPFRYRRGEKKEKKRLLLSLLSLLLKRNWVRNLLQVMFKHYVICHGILSCVSSRLFRGRESGLCLRRCFLHSSGGHAGHFTYRVFLYRKLGILHTQINMYGYLCLYLSCNLQCRVWLWEINDSFLIHCTKLVGERESLEFNAENFSLVYS